MTNYNDRISFVKTNFRLRFIITGNLFHRLPFHCSQVLVELRKTIFINAHTPTMSDINDAFAY